MKPMEARRAELLEHVAARAAATVVDYFGLASELADQVGAAVADALADDFGGQVLSFPKDCAFRLSVRDRAILEAHRRGASLADLALQYKITDRGLRMLLHRAESRDRDLRQQQLFEGRP